MTTSRRNVLKSIPAIAAATSLPAWFVEETLAQDAAPAAADLSGALASTFNLTAIRGLVKALRGEVKKNRDYVLLAGLELR